MRLFSAEPYIQRGCGQVYNAAVLLCPVLPTQCEASIAKAVFKDFWRLHLHLLYLSVFSLTCVKEHIFSCFYIPPNRTLVILSNSSIPPDSW